MGQRAREKRKSVKAYLRLNGWRENEFGELRHVGTKAQARSNIAGKIYVRKLAEIYDILDIITTKAKEDIQEQEDREVFKMIDDAIGILSLPQENQTKTYSSTNQR